MTDGPGKVCVIGAGPAGIVTAKTLLGDGFDVTVYEKHDDVGGTWSAQRRYAGLNHQLADGLAEFPDQPWGDGYADAEAFQSYLRSYATEFDVLDHIEFDTPVTGVERTAEGWQVTAGGAAAGPYDYLAVCTGLHHHPQLPSFADTEEFDGRVVHSSALGDAQQLSGQRVAVVGGGKSAYSLSVAASRHADETTHVFRQPHWMLPKSFLRGLVPAERILFSRFGESLLPRYYNDDCVSWVDKLPRRLKDLVWERLVRDDIVKTTGLDELPDDCVPAEPLPRNVAVAGMMPDEYVPRASDGRIEPVRAEVERLGADGLTVSTGETVPADTVVCATGFEKRAPPVEETVPVTDDETIRLYRSIVPPSEPTVGFVGWRQTFNNFLSMAVSAHWLSEWFRDRLIDRPTPAEMRACIDRRVSWMREEFPNTRGFDYHAYDCHSVDELLLDMGLEPAADRNPITELFGLSASPRRYAGLKTRRDRVAR